MGWGALLGPGPGFKVKDARSRCSPKRSPWSHGFNQTFSLALPKLTLTQELTWEGIREAAEAGKEEGAKPTEEMLSRSLP